MPPRQNISEPARTPDPVRKYPLSYFLLSWRHTHYNTKQQWENNKWQINEISIEMDIIIVINDHMIKWNNTKLLYIYLFNKWL